MTRSTFDRSISGWRKSSYSNDDGGACVEVADGVPGIVPVRDSKDLAQGILAIAPSSWTSLATTLKAR